MADNTKVIIDNFDYRLYLGHYIEKTQEKETEIPPLHAKQNIYINIRDTEYSVVLSGLKFTRKVYEPGLIEAEVTIKTKSEDDELPLFEDVSKLFVRRQAELTLVDIDKAATSTADYEETIAKNYYVYKINPQIAANNSQMEMYVKLTIYSFDKLMDVDKYCKAFTAKKLSSGILAKEYPAFGIASDMVQADVSILQHLKYKDSQSRDTEVIQPYLVQYNETFYDFLVRTANRCGEFLYFEDGRLTLGLPESEAGTIASFTSVTMEGSTPSTIDVEDFARDSAKDDGKIQGTLNYDVIEKDKAGYPTDSFLTKLQYNTPLGGDEYIFPLENDKYNNLNRELCVRGGEQYKTILLRAAEGVVTSEDNNVLNIAAKATGKFTADTEVASYFLSQNDLKVNKDLDEAWKNAPEQYDKKKLVAFSSLDEKGWIGRSFYAAVRHQEEELHRKMICIDMGTSYVPVRLGERIRVKGLKGDYIVTQVSLMANLTWQHNYRKFDPADSTTDICAGSQSQVIYAIPVGHPKDSKGTENPALDLIIPPVAPVPAIRKAGPQTAFVVDSDDKKYQGRVRIAYPWQSSNDNSRQELFAAQESLRKATAAYDSGLKKRMQLQAAISLLVNDIKDMIEEMEKMSKADLKRKYEALQREAEVHKSEMARLDNELEQMPPDPILNDGASTISYEDYTMNVQARKKNRNSYEDHRKELEKIELLQKYLGESDCDPQKAKEILSADCQKLVNEEKALSDEMEKQEKDVAEKKAQVEKKAEQWDKVLAGIATPWVRVAQPMATSGGGAFFKPNKGDEVLVNFDNDNVERPYVVGSVYSKNVLSPGEDLDKQVKNFLQKRASIALMSPNGQHISFTAPSDGWKFVQGFSPTIKTLQTYFPASVGDAKFGILKGDEKDLNGGIYMGDRYGMYELSLSSHDRKIKINSPFGNVEIGAFTGITIEAPNGDIKIRGKNVSIEAGNKLTLHSGQNVKDKRQAVFGVSAGDAIANVATGALSPIGNIAKFVDFAVLRCFLEVFLRPIDGTLCLKSNNYVMLEAGKGKAQVPVERYTKRYRDAYVVDEDHEKKVFYSKVTAYIQRINGKITRFQNDYLSLKRNAYLKKAAYERSIDAVWNPTKEKPNIVNPAFAVGDGNFIPNTTISQEMSKVKRENLIISLNGWQVPGYKNTNKVGGVQRYISLSANDYGSAIVVLEQKSRQLKTMFDEHTIKAVNLSLFGEEKDEDTEWIDDVFKASTYEAANNLLEQQVAKWEDRYGTEGANPKAPFMRDDDQTSAQDPLADLIILKRKMIATFLANLNDHENNLKEQGLLNAIAGAPEPGKFIALSFHANEVTDNLVKDKWDEIAAIGDYAKDKKTIAGEIGDVLNDAFSGSKIAKEVKGWGDFKDGNKVWNSQSGQIIFSSSPGATYAFKNDEIETFDVSNQNKNKAALKKTLGQIK